MMKKIVLGIVALAGTFSFVSAQKLEDGISELYYNKFTTAEQTFKKLIEKHSDDGQAIYWLGQVYLKNIDGETNSVGHAESVYQNAYTAGVKDAWILIGLGQIDYINHKNNEAEEKFEQAVALSDKFKGRNKDIDKAAVLTAIGRASAYGNKDVGDPMYAIPKLQEAMNLDKQNVEAAIYLGMNFLKLGGDQGGNAYSAFLEASNRDLKSASGYYHLGLIFESQDNFDVMNDWYQKGIAADPKFGPIYLHYFQYYNKEGDFAKAQEYLNKYIENSDNGCETQYFRANYLFRQGHYQESIDKAKEMMNGTCASYPHLPMLLAANYHRTGDTAQAVTYAQKFFATVAPSNIQPYDYAFAGYIYKDAPGLADSAVVYLKKAYELDTLASEKAIYADSIAYALAKANKPIEKYKWVRSLYEAKDTGMRTNLDIYNVGKAALDAAGEDPKYFATADTMFTLYKTKYPKEAYGYYYLEQIKLAQDTSSIVQAIPAINNYINFMKQDTVKYKPQLIQEYARLGQYYVYTIKDYVKGLEMFQHIVDLDPTNTGAASAVEQLKKAVQQQKELEEYYAKHPEKRPAKTDSTSNK